MSTIKIDLRQMLLDRRLTVTQFAAEIGVHYQTAYAIIKRGRAKLSFVKRVEDVYGSLVKYIGTGDKDIDAGDPVETGETISQDAA